MVQIGYALSSEEHHPTNMVRNAQRAEEVGFTFALISDHFHPWIDQQGNSPFVWSVLGGIAQVTKNLSIGTGVTCPHPSCNYRTGSSDHRRYDAGTLLSRCRLR